MLFTLDRRVEGDFFFFWNGRLFVTIILEKIFQLIAKEMNTDDWEIRYFYVLTEWDHNNRGLNIIHTFICSALFFYVK